MDRGHGSTRVARNSTSPAARISKMVRENKSVEVEGIPTNYTCPISLEVMVEPVTLSTGFSFERENIERWLGEGNISCPMTLQVLVDPCFVPNHILQNLIQCWYTDVWLELRAAGSLPMGYDLPTPIQVRLLVRELTSRAVGSRLSPNVVRRVRSIAKRADYRDRTVLTRGGAVAQLVDLLLEDSEAARELFVDTLGALAVLPMDRSQWQRIALSSRAFARIVEMLVVPEIVTVSDRKARVYATEMLSVLAEAQELRGLIGQSSGVLKSLLAIIDLGGGSAKLSRAAIRTLLHLCHNPKLRAETACVGAVGVLVGNLPSFEKDVIEKSLAILEQLCRTAEGRAHMIEHPLAIPTLVKLMNRISEWAAGYATSALCAVCKADPELGGLAAIQCGAFPQLLLVVQSDSSLATKRKAVELLKLLRNLWEFYHFPSQYNPSSTIP